jgi:hypothetical protein
VAFIIEKPPDDHLMIEIYVGVYIYKSYNKGGFNSASVGVKLFNPSINVSGLTLQKIVQNFSLYEMTSGYKSQFLN